jgi:hypothetical protein
MSVVTLFLAFLIANTISYIVFASSKSPYESGYDHGCDDADISDPDNRYINQPEKGQSFHTDEFMHGYNDGYDDCQNENENANLPLCDGSNQDCVTEDGYVCEAGSTDEECELNGYYCIEDIGCGNFVHGICEDCKPEGEGNGGKGLKVIVHFRFDSTVCVDSGDDPGEYSAGCKNGKAGETRTFQFGLGQVEVGKKAYARWHEGGNEEIASEVNGPERGPIHIYQ